MTADNRSRPHRADTREWAGRCAFVLACGLATGWCGALLVAAVYGGPISDHSANMISAIGGAMSGAVATYLGSTLHTAQQRRAADHQEST